jgi:hypothetical protein
VGSEGNTVSTGASLFNTINTRCFSAVKVDQTLDGRNRGWRAGVDHSEGEPPDLGGMVTNVGPK